jgi:flagellum-specific peptidoglycan hydrolase FlgJ
MNKTRNIALLIFLIIIFMVVVNRVLAVSNLSLKYFPKFEYQDKNVKQRWYNYTTPLAKVVGKHYGIPWQAIVVQTAVETGWGKSKLFQEHNNWGGIKARPGQSSINLPTLEFLNGQYVQIVDGFRTWPTPYAGLIGYAQFFHENPRYSTALQFPHDPYQFIIEIKNAGYATDPNYIQKLHSLLKDLA